MFEENLKNDMGLEFYNLSHRFGYQSPNWPYFEDVKIERIHYMAKSGVLSQRITTSMHNTTHIDAPAHVVQGTPFIDEVPLPHFFGSGIVVSIPKKKWEPITGDDKKKLGDALTTIRRPIRRVMMEGAPAIAAIKPIVLASPLSAAMTTAPASTAERARATAGGDSVPPPMTTTAPCARSVGAVCGVGPEAISTRSLRWHYPDQVFMVLSQFRFSRNTHNGEQNIRYKFKLENYLVFVIINLTHLFDAFYFRRFLHHNTFDSGAQRHFRKRTNCTRSEKT